MSILEKYRLEYDSNDIDKFTEMITKDAECSIFTKSINHMITIVKEEESVKETFDDGLLEKQQVRSPKFALKIDLKEKWRNLKNKVLNIDSFDTKVDKLRAVI